jgi:hypothetical protein
LLPVTLDHLPFEERFQVAIEHHPVAPKPYGDPFGRERSLLHKKLHDLEASRIHEPENPNRIYK